MAGKIKGLQQWCRKMTEGYPRVDITNFTTAWRDGLAFCAIIHRFRPDLIDFDSLSPENVFENCKMAFEIAQKELSIPAFLEADDMVRLKVPDKLSIITYVSQYYNYLHSLPQLGGPSVKSKISGKTASGVKRPTDSDSTQGPISKKATTVETKENAAPAEVAAAPAGDRCGICHEHVYLIERHMEDGKLYHRSCFRRSELSPANRVYTRSPFMSPALSSEAQKLTVSKAENKTSLLSKTDKDGLVTNLQRHMDNQPKKAESDTKLSRKLDFVGSKHPIDEPAREDTKKSKMQPRMLFDDEKTRKASTEKDKSAAYSSNKSNEVNKVLPLSSKEAHKLEKRQEDIGSEKASKEQPGHTMLNTSVFSQQKNKATQEIPTTVAASVPPNNKSQTKYDNNSMPSKISVAALSLQPPSESSQSKSKSAFGKDSHKISKESEKLALSKDIQKSSDKKNVDIATSKSNLLPDIHNLQKLFSGKPADVAESVGYPRAKPRNSTIIRSENQEASRDMMATKPNENETAAPKPTPRNSILGISAPKQPDVSSQVKKSAFETEANGRSSASKHLAAGISLSVSKSAQNQLSTSSTSSPFDGTYKAPSTETKASVTGKNTDEPRNVPLINKPHSLQQKIGANKVMNQNSIDVKSANKSGHTSVLNVSNVIKTTAVTSLSTTISDSAVRTTPTPAKLQSSAPLSQAQSENKFISSSRNPINKTVNATPASYPGNLVSETQTTHPSAGVSSSVKLMANTNGTQSTKTVEKSVVTQMSKDSHKTVVSTPKLQTPNKMQEALSVFSSGKPVSGAFGITFTNNSAKGDANLTKPHKVKDSSSEPVLSRTTDIHNKEKTISDKPSQNINQNKQVKPSSGNLLNSKDNQQKSAVKTNQTDFKQTDKHEAKGLSSVKDSAISSSKEDILDINNVKLKRVMPEQREIQNEQKATVYDIKLKKVDVIKGDSRWDSSSQKPSRSVDVAGAGHEHKTAGSHFSNGEINREVSSNKGMDARAAALSAGVSNSHTTTPQKVTSEMPQWKKATEEKQRKLKDNVVSSEHKTDSVKHSKHNSDNITPLTFDSKTGPAGNGKTSKREHISVGVLSLPKTPSGTVSTEKETAKPLTTQTNGNKVPPTAEDPVIVKKLDWQLEAEKRMAAIASFDKGIVGQLKVAEKSEMVSSDSQGNQVQRNTAAQKTEMSKENKNNDKARLNGETVTDNNRITSKTTTSVVKNSVVKAKETELKVTVNKLKSTPVQEISKEVELSSDTKQTSNGEAEDFRQVLHQLKHVTTEDTGKIDSAKPDSETCLPSKQTTHDINTPTANRAIPNNTVNKNSNNNQNISDLHNTQVLNKNTGLSVKTPELEDLADENGNVRKDGIFEVSEKKHSMGKSRFAEKGSTTSPKVKRKLSIPDKKTREMPSPSSPTQRKKIQITSKFDFEKSSDFEQSLTLSTSKLTIKENSTPEKLMSSPSSQDTLSPQHISAIELQQQLHNIDTRLTELELKGRELENSIRKGGSAISSCVHGLQFGDCEECLKEMSVAAQGLDKKVNSLDEDDDKLMIEWFMIINEKNDLVRKEADLIYLSKEQELEDEQEQIESQLYYLMTKPDECKSPEEKEEEDYLINRKIALVEQRNKIIDSMDEDRLRYEAEDKNIEVTLKDKGYWKDSTGTLKAVKGKKVANSMFYT